MRVLHWAIPFFPERGGRSLWIEGMILAFAQRGHQVSVITEASTHLTSSRSRLGDNVKIIQLEAGLTVGRSVNAGYFSKVAAAIESIQPDVIHVHNLESPDLSLLRLYKATIGKSIPVVCTLHDLVSVRRLQRFFSTMEGLRFFSAVVSPSRFIDAHFDDVAPTARAKLRIINHGVAAASTQESIRSGSPSLLFAADLQDHKGGIIMLSAWNRLFERYPDVILSIAGEGPAKKFLQEYAESCKFGSQVRFLGWLTSEELNSILIGDCICVVPSLLGEAFGLIAAEGAMAGAALIVSRSGALPEIVEDGVSGLVVSPGDSLDLVRAMERLLMNSDLRFLLGKAARDRAQRLFTMEKSVKTYERLYEELVFHSN